MGVSFKTLLAAGLALAGSMIVQPAPAEAQPYWGHRHYHAGWGYRPSYGYAPRAYFGPRYYGYRYGYPYYRRHSAGGALAAGLIGGLALGAIASAAANPYYAPAYYRPVAYAPRRCFIERRRFVNPYGRVVVRRIETCY